MSARALRRLLLVVAAVVVGAVAGSFVPKPLPEISRLEFLAEVRAGHVHRIEIEDREVILGESTSRGPFRTGFDRRKDAGLPDALQAQGVEIRYSSSPPTP